MHLHPAIKQPKRAVLAFIASLAIAFMIVACGLDAQAPTSVSTSGFETTTPQSDNTPNSSGTPSATEPAQTPFASSTPTDSTPSASATPTADDATPASSPSPTSMPPLTGRAEHPDGVSFSYPEGWEELKFAAISTQFAAGAECVTVRIIDREAPAGSGQAPFLLQSVVQVCSQPANETPLETFMEQTYGVGMGGFETFQIANETGYRLTEGETTTAYVQHGDARFQVVTAVIVEDPTTESLRRGQVQSIVASVRME